MRQVTLECTVAAYCFESLCVYFVLISEMICKPYKYFEFDSYNRNYNHGILFFTT